MSLIPTIVELLARARADLRMGLPVVLRSEEGLALAASAEVLTPERLGSMRAEGAPVLAITARRAETLKARAYDGDLARIAVPGTASVDWIAQVADPADDMTAPMKGPFETLRAGSPEPHRAAIALAKSARLLPAMVVAPTTAEHRQLTRINIDLASEALHALSPLAPVVSGRVPLSVSEAGRVHVFRPDDGGEEHYVVEIGRPARDKPVLTRLHSACFTGDILGSLKCDCGPQLQAALQQMGTAGEGILLYLNQEGRGIGLANKMRAYSLQDQGFDTVEANHRLGFEDDERDFRIGADILKRLGFASVRLMTNNPAKTAMMEACGVGVVERVPLKVGLNPLNEKYLNTKAKKSGHIL
ncbi:3,4-dihydroxy-2-butanone 4-phosphate synthase [Candidatus Rhodobacter oscarellae]|uniref:GTP cyclohydrolase-2 n=1 Tax=Candidatus Rhodobacter oscarellae TaxID=1675527 RepID=A0A0J9GYT9_9RHOB|nr:GTP cyclohydrolase II [Candidatus Rhodobacter lobularis]KMW58618.1 3,4-dihydroxy-2-butanone 4-phosphate synthase [Candidatus Rhodobacter lobularis]